MATSTNGIDIKDIVASPNKYFDSPNEVVSADNLSLENKKKILENWKNICEELMMATSEGMEGGKRPDLKQVTEGLRVINHKLDQQ